MILVEDLAVRQGAFAIRNVNLRIETSEYCVLMGRTGSGKTTLLEAICGLRGLEAGRIRLMERDVTRLTPAQRGIGYVPQDRALFQSMTVRENLAFALVIRRWPRAEVERRVGDLAELLGLSPLLERRPAGLSGGEAQRVALGRALACRPELLLLDEPLSALDDETRGEMYKLLKSVREHTGVTTLHVTHNMEEAGRLADRVFVFKEGRIESR